MHEAGTGKTRLSGKVSHRLDAVYPRIDLIEWAMTGSSLRIDSAGDPDLSR